MKTDVQTYVEKAEHGGGGVSFLPISRRINDNRMSDVNNLCALYFQFRWTDVTGE